MCEQRLRPTVFGLLPFVLLVAFVTGRRGRRPLQCLVRYCLFWLRLFIFKRFNTHPHRVILERSEGSRWVRRAVNKHYFVGRCLGAAALMGLNRSSRREQAPALRVCVYIVCLYCTV